MPNEDALWLPPLSPKDQQKLDRFRSKGKKSTSNWTGFAGRTLWDWIQLLGVLAIPLVVAGATLVFGVQQAHLADVQHQNDLRIAQDNRQNDLTIANDQQQEATLKAYLDDMTTLLVDEKLGSRAVGDQSASAEAAVVAQAKTLLALRRLNTERKAIVLQFLYEAHLIGYCNSHVGNCSTAVAPIIDLSKTDLSKTNLINLDLSGANLSGADLSGADLSRTIFLGANLTRANLAGADLSFANLSFADLSDTTLSNTILRDANLSNTNLIGANMGGADLGTATLSNAELGFANLSGANLFEVNLSSAYLRDAIVNQDQLSAAASLAGATMPDGSKHP
jgi:uncharacterized protein YjbI with pentapeptide repeats